MPPADLPKIGPRPLVAAGLVLAMSGGTAGVTSQDAGVASALVNTAQQIGGSIGTAVLSTNAATDYLTGKIPTADIAAAAVHSYTTTFAWVGGLFLVGALVCGLLLRCGPLQVDPDAAPTAHM